MSSAIAATMSSHAADISTGAGVSRDQRIVRNGCSSPSTPECPCWAGDNPVLFRSARNQWSHKTPARTVASGAVLNSLVPDGLQDPRTWALSSIEANGSRANAGRRTTPYRTSLIRHRHPAGAEVPTGRPQFFALCAARSTRTQWPEGPVPVQLSYGQTNNHAQRNQIVSDRFAKEQHAADMVLFALAAGPV